MCVKSNRACCTFCKSHSNQVIPKKFWSFLVFLGSFPFSSNYFPSNRHKELYAMQWIHYSVKQIIKHLDHINVHLICVKSWCVRARKTHTHTPMTLISTYPLSNVLASIEGKTLDLYRALRYSSSPNPIFRLNKANGVFNFRQYAEQETNHSYICSLQQNTAMKSDTMPYLGSKVEDK